MGTPPVDSRGHLEVLAALTLQMVRGRARDVIQPLDGLIGAAGERGHEAAAADLRTLRAIAELEIERQAAGLPRADSPIATMLAFGVHVLPALAQLANAPSNPMLAYQLNAEIFGAIDSIAGYDASAVEVLSPRETEVLSLIEAGASNRQIADRLFISEGTVKKHVSNVLSKLGASNRTHAVNHARRIGLI